MATTASTGQLRVAILGAKGRMGKAVLMALEEVAGAVLSGAAVSAGNPSLGQSIREATVTADLAQALQGATVAIDFTAAQATADNLNACVAAGCPLVLGTTGHDVGGRAQVAAASRNIPIVMAPNMSLGVNLLLKLAELTAKTLNSDYDVEIFEAHHRHKKDSPSGTALGLGEAVAKGRDVSLDDVAEYARHGISEPRRKGTIGFSVFRGGDVVGDHTVTFAGIGERIELTHRASDRMAFARGALVAAQWVVSRPPGLYSMQDVLGLA
jgi:4-hydroxy-tetrahydrodipicolinate reductase